MKDFDVQNIMETIEMIKVHHLDIRTVTLALSLRDCASEDIKKVGVKIYDKILKHANEREDEATIFGYYVKDPKAYGASGCAGIHGSRRAHET